jgi:hypothetical protein
LPFTERRRARRYDLHLPITIRWDKGAERREAITVSQDVSSNGTLFALSEGIPEGTVVELEMTLPDQITHAGPLRVHCYGRITRCVLEEGKSARMAVQIQEYEFLRRSDRSNTEESRP